MKHFMTCSVFIFLPCLVSCLKIDSDGIIAHYNVTNFLDCGYTDVNKLRHLKLKSSLSDCVKECVVGQHCKALNYIGNMQICELLPNEVLEFRNSLGSETSGHCIYISKKDIAVEKVSYSFSF